MNVLRPVCRLVLLLSALTHVDTGNVLFLSVPWRSLINRNLNLAEALVKYGYNSTIVTNAVYASKLQTGPHVDIIIANSFYQFLEGGKLLFQKMCTDGDFNVEFEKHFLEEQKSFCRSVLADKELYDTLKNKMFDAVIIEETPCFTMLAYNLSLPRIYAGVPFTFVKWRIPFMPSVTKAHNLNDFSDKMTFFQRVMSTATAILVALSSNQAASDETIIYAPGIPHRTVEELHATHQFILMDSDPVLDFPTPTMPNAALVGGLSIREPKALHGPLKAFMDFSTNGVIIVAFGSETILLPQWKLELFITAFKLIPKLSFVFKYGDTIKYDNNIMMLPWISQNDLLAHPNTKAFITHCGNAGQYEALYHAVPMICVPLAGDQIHNSKRMTTKGFGIHLDFCSNDENAIADAISEILNETYKHAISKASRIFHSHPRPKERAAYWIDHVIQYGGDYLQPPYLPFYQYYLLDVLAFVCFILISSMLLSVLVCLSCYRLCCKRKIKED